MPTRSEIERELNSAARAKDNVRRRFLKELAEYTGRTTILYASASGITTAPAGSIVGADFSMIADDIPAFMDACHGVDCINLDLILHSPGGRLDAAEAIVAFLRQKFQNIRAIVPQYAMSAATMLACACNEIVMGKHSSLGPTDPQFTLPRPNRPVASVSAASILEEFELARKQIQENPRAAGAWAPKLLEVPPGLLIQCKQAIDRGSITVTQWLQQYMGLDLPTATAAGEWLSDTREHRAHGKPIDANLALSKGLKIVKLEDDPRLQDLVLSVFHATMLTFETSTCGKIIENHAGRGRYVTFKSRAGP